MVHAAAGSKGADLSRTSIFVPEHGAPERLQRSERRTEAGLPGNDRYTGTAKGRSIRAHDRVALPSGRTVRSTDVITRGRVALDRSTKTRAPKPLTAEEPDRLWKEGNVELHAQAISAAFGLGGTAPQSLRTRWKKALGEITTREDVARVRGLFEKLDPERADEHVVRFWNAVVHAKRTRSPEIQKLLDRVPDDWAQHSTPYELYVDSFGTADGKKTATFEDTVKMFPYLQHLGVNTLSLRPIFESPGWDGGYDISKFTPAESLGGAAAYEKMVKEGLEHGLYTIWDLVINHVSIQHPWYQKLIAGDESMLDRFVVYDGVEILGSEIRNGDKWIKYRWPDGVEEEQLLIFSDNVDDHLARIEVNGKPHQLFRTFNSFQLDINAKNPDVLEWVLQLVGNHLNAGTLGIRLDALRHVMKRRGVPAHDLEETHVLQEILKHFVKHVSPKAIIVPEVVAGSAAAAPYFGRPTTIAGKPTTSGADAMYDFDRRGVLHHILFFQKSQPYWDKIYGYPETPDDAIKYVPLGTHDEVFVGFIPWEHDRYWIGEYAKERGCIPFKNGMSVTGRNADLLDNDPRRIANSFFVQSVFFPGTNPTIYAGDEIGWRNNWDYARDMHERQYRALREEAGIQVEHDRAFDARWIHRGAIPASAFEHAVEEKYPALEMIRTMLALKRTNASLRGGGVHGVANGHAEVISAVRSSPNDEEPAMLAVSNLSFQPKQVRIPLDHLRLDGELQLKDQLGNGGNERIADGHLVIDLEPYDQRLFQINSESARWR